VRPDWQDLAVAPVLAVDGTIFAVVVIGVVVAAVVVAAACALAGRDAYDHIGRGGLSAGTGPREGEDQREEEIRQLLGARRERRARRAGTGVTAPEPRPIDPGVVEEIRQLVAAGNARRLRRGLEPLDVDEEVARRLRELAAPGH
jgi:hypothetical protein